MKYIRTSILFNILKNIKDNYLVLTRSLKNCCYTVEMEKVYEDKIIILINKPQNIIIYSDKKFSSNNLLEVMHRKYKKIKIINRIDKETAGLILISKNKLSNIDLYKQMIKKRIKKNYIALIYGEIFPKNGEIKTKIRSRNEKITISKSSITFYRTINVYEDKILSLLEIELKTGITHQIRLHMKYKNTSIIGDLKYFVKKNIVSKEIYSKFKYLGGQGLQAYKISFIHPISLQFFQFTIPINFKLKNVISLYNIIN